MDSFRCHCVEGLAANRKRIDELMRLDACHRACEAAHLNGASLQEEALASGLVSAGEFDALVRPEAMLAPDD